VPRATAELQTNLSKSHTAALASIITEVSRGPGSPFPPIRCSAGVCRPPTRRGREDDQYERLFRILFFGAMERIGCDFVPHGLIHPQEISMKKFSFVLAALAAVSFAMPSIASAEDAKPDMMKEGMHKEGMMHHHHHMMMHHRHMMHYHHHMMKKEMKKDM
jgi:hypothetical protein